MVVAKAVPVVMVVSKKWSEKFNIRQIEATGTTLPRI